MDRREIVAQYIKWGWVPFAYEGQFTPPAGWQRSVVDDDTLDRIARAKTPIGLLTGKPSGIVIVDIDARNGGSAKKFLQHYGLSPKSTRVVSSASKGSWHVYFKYPTGVDRLPKTKGERTGLSALTGTDLLADGAHVFAPPTIRVGHPDKADGQYTVRVDIEPAEMPEALLVDWMAATVRQTPEGKPVGYIEPQHYEWVMGLHERNIKMAASAVEGTRDDVCTARLGASIRIAASMPDIVLSFDKVREDFENGVPYEIKDLDGKVKRAVDWAERHAWKEMEQDGDLPEGVPASRAQEYFDELTKLRIRAAAKRSLEIEELERRTSSIEVGPVHDGSEFMKNKPNAPEYIVDGLVHYEGSVLLAGQYKSGKSTLMLNLIKALTTGGTFLGRFDVPRAVKVGYFDMELGEVLAWKWLHELRGTDYSKLAYIPRLGQGKQLNMQSDTLRANTARMIREKELEVLILDPLSPIMSALGVEENNANTVRPMLDSFDMLKHDAGLKALIVTHHTGHGDQGRARGSTAFMDWHTSFMGVMKTGMEFDSPRVFMANGRDVQVNTSSLIFDPETRELRLGDRIVESDPEEFGLGD